MSDKKSEKARKGHSPSDGTVSRRNFLTTAGIGAIGVAAVGPATPAKQREADIDQAAGTAEPKKVALQVNGRTHRLLVEPRWSLLYVLRERLGLTGTKIGCERGECGACTVLIDGLPRYACLTLAVEAEGQVITTVEGLLHGEKLGPVQQAFQERDAMQCGYCTSGQIMAVEGLLRVESQPSTDQIRKGISGNLCRCGTYPKIVEAAQHAGELKRGEEGGLS